MTEPQKHTGSSGSPTAAAMEAERARNDNLKPKHGDPTKDQPVPEGGSVIGVRVGSEASVEDGTDPVLPSEGSALGEATRVRNKTLRGRDEKEHDRRGRGGNAVTVSFEGPMMVEVDGSSEGQGGVKSGSFTGSFKEKLTVRKLTDKEEAEYLGKEPQPQSSRGGTTTRSGG